MIKINATISFSLEDFFNSILQDGLSNQYSGNTKKAPKKALGSQGTVSKKATWSKRCLLQLGLDVIIDKESLIKNRAPNRQRHTRAERILQKGKQSTYAKAHKLVR